MKFCNSRVIKECHKQLIKKYSFENITDVLDVYFQIINSHLVQGDEVYIGNLGALIVKKMAAKRRRNKYTKAIYFSPERKTLRIKPSSTIRKKLNPEKLENRYIDEKYIDEKKSGIIEKQTEDDLDDLDSELEQAEQFFQDVFAEANESDNLDD